MSLQLTPPQHTSSTAHLFGDLTSTCLVSTVSIKKKCLCLTCNFSSLPLHLPLCCSMLRRHLQTSLIPSVTKTTRQRVIKIAPAALCLMSLSAHRSFGATSQQHAASIWPKSSFTNRVTLQTTEPKSHLCSFIQKLYC